MPSNFLLYSLQFMIYISLYVLGVVEREKGLRVVGLEGCWGGLEG